MSRHASLSELSTHLNVVVLRGVLSSPPRVRELPSGDALILLEVTTRGAAEASTAPVVVPHRDVQVAALDTGAEVVVVGRVARRYFRAGGVTQSRTEVVAERVVPAGQRRAVDRAVRRAVGLLGARGVGVG
jgi:single-strand DNA-binding protein